MSFLTGNFFYNGKPLSSAPLWGMSVLESGNMRFRWNETNSVRDNFFLLFALKKEKLRSRNSYIQKLFMKFLARMKFLKRRETEFLLQINSSFLL